ncbi:MAG: hypothetical protein WBL44_03795 [Nitrososphaeraceae archaeon]
MVILIQNSFPMKEWHIQHMEKTVVKYIKGLPENATAWEKRQHRRYGGITRVCRQINYDIKHGVTNEQVLELLEAIKTDSTYLYLRNDVDCMDRLTEIEGLFIRTPQSVASPRFIVE